MCNGKPPKGIIPAKLFANYQYFQHSAKTDLLVSKEPNDEKFKKVENTSNSSTMYSNIKIIGGPHMHHDINSGPPPLAPMDDSAISYTKLKNATCKSRSPSTSIANNIMPTIYSRQNTPPSHQSRIKQEFDSHNVKLEGNMDNQSMNSNSNPSISKKTTSTNRKQ